MAAILSTNPRTKAQIIDSREGLFWYKKGRVCKCGKMNIYLIKTPFAPFFWLFAAKCSAIWCLMHCNMPLNAVRFAAKCSVFWWKTQGKMALNAVRFAAKR